MKTKASQKKLVEYGMTNTAAQLKRNHKEVGSPSSPEAKNSPKKTKAMDKQNKK